MQLITLHELKLHDITQGNQNAQSRSERPILEKLNVQFIIFLIEMVREEKVPVFKAQSLTFISAYMERTAPMVPVDIWVNYMWKDNKIQAKMYF